jgi:hypothetical protein
LKISDVWIAHQYYWTYDPVNNPSITSDAQRTLAAGGVVHYINWRVLGYVYPNAGTQLNSLGQVCSTGAHTHVEVKNPHNFGVQYEWHSAQGPDFFASPSNHIHPGWGSCCDDTVTAGGRRLGILGSNSYQLYMEDNPYYSNH